MLYYIMKKVVFTLCILLIILSIDFAIFYFIRREPFSNKSYTKEEVKKHNTRDDAWVIYKNKVYNVTDWISKHPGGDAIMKGIGKDITKLFDGRGHSNTARKIMKKYYIGDLK